MSPATVFLDTGIFIAFLVARDRWHGSALALFSSPRRAWCTSALVRSEAYSWFLHRHGEEAARRFRLLIDSLEGLTIFETTAAHHEETCAVLDRLRGARLTYVDASSLALIARHDIGTVWATDHHLGLTGAEVLPRS